MLTSHGKLARHAVACTQLLLLLLLLLLLMLMMRERQLVALALVVVVGACAALSQVAVSSAMHGLGVAHVIANVIACLVGHLFLLLLLLLLLLRACALGNPGRGGVEGVDGGAGEVAACCAAADVVLKHEAVAILARCAVVALATKHVVVKVIARVLAVKKLGGHVVHGCFQGAALAGCRAVVELHGRLALVVQELARCHRRVAPPAVGTRGL